MARATRTYGGVSAEDRLADRRERLINAGLDVLGSEGLANMTMTGVCASSGLTERYFYESFRNLEELQLAMFTELATEGEQAIVTAFDAAPPDLFERCRAAAIALLDLLLEDPRKARMFAESISSGVLRERRHDAFQGFAAMLSEQMRELVGLTADHQQPHLEFVTTMLIGGLAEVVAVWISRGMLVSRDQLIDDAARLAVAAAGTIPR
jgi:AcrR family transcriptional regulator